MRKNEYEIGYVIGIYDGKKNRCVYLVKNLRWSSYITGSLIVADIMPSETANSIVETIRWSGRNIPNIEDRKNYKLFVSKVFHNERYVKLTKQNAFQLLEIIGNNI